MDINIAQKLDDLNDDRIEGIANLTQKGVTAYDTDGFSQIVSKILEIPSDKLTSVRVNNEISYRKQVPSGSAGFCYLNSIGGMTYKGFTFDCTVQEFNGEYSAPYSFTFPKAFTFPTDDLYAFSPIVCGRTDAPIVDASALYTLSGTTMTGRGTIFNADIPVGTQLRCIPRFENQETGEYWFPPECFTDLRDAKPTAVVSHSANLIPFPYYFTRTGFGEMDVGFTKEWAGLTFTINADRGISVKGTATGTPSFVIGEYLDLPSEDMYLSANMVGTFDGRAYVYTTDENGEYYTTDIRSAEWVKLPKEKSFSWVGVQIFSGTTIDATFYPMLNTGSSPLPYSPYFKKTYTLPTAITDKLGKGCSDTLYDEYSFVDKKAITRVGEGIVNDLEYEVSGSVIRKSFTQAGFSEMRNNTNGTYVTYAQMPFFGSGYSILQINADAYLEYLCTIYGRNLCLYVPAPLVIADTDAFISWIHSQNLHYVAELQNFTETPITLAPTDFDGLIEVEAGGYLEFVNEYGYAVPSTVTFSLINRGGTT